MRTRPVDLLGALLADVEALEGAACAGSPAEFVDVDQAHAEHLVRTWCWTCPVAARCCQMGEDLAPHGSASIYGGRYYPAHATTSVPVLTRRAS